MINSVTRMKWLAIVGLGLWAQSVWSLGIGKVMVNSTLNQPLVAVAPILGSDAQALQNHCIGIERAHVEPRQLLTLSSRLSPGNPPTLRIKSREPVRGALINISVRIGCDNAIKREISLNVPGNAQQVGQAGQYPRQRAPRSVNRPLSRSSALPTQPLAQQPALTANDPLAVLDRLSDRPRSPQQREPVTAAIATPLLPEQQTPKPRYNPNPLFTQQANNSALSPPPLLPPSSTVAPSALAAANARQPVNVQGYSGAWAANGIDNLADIARQIYPKNRLRQRHVLTEMIKKNKALLGRRVSARTVPQNGQVITIPSLFGANAPTVVLSNADITRSARQAVRKSSARKSKPKQIVKTKKNKTATERVAIEPKPVDAEVSTRSKIWQLEHRLTDAPAGSSRQLTAVDGVTATSLERENALLSQLNQSMALQLKLTEKINKLEANLGQLNQKTSSAEGQVLDNKDDDFDALMLALIAGILGLGGVLAWRRFRPKRPEESLFESFDAHDDTDHNVKTMVARMPVLDDALANNNAVATPMNTPGVMPGQSAGVAVTAAHQDDWRNDEENAAKVGVGWYQRLRSKMADALPFKKRVDKTSVAAHLSTSKPLASPTMANPAALAQPEELTQPVEVHTRRFVESQPLKSVNNHTLDSIPALDMSRIIEEGPSALAVTSSEVEPTAAEPATANASASSVDPQQKLATEALRQRSAITPPPSTDQALAILDNFSLGLYKNSAAETLFELAELMLSFGAIKGAEESLRNYVTQYPDESLRPWIKLLRLYKTHTMRDAFEHTAAEVHLYFNVAIIPWESKTTARARVPMTIEEVPHIANRISHLWGTRAGADYLHHLVHDHRSGERGGLSLSVLIEVMCLIDILSELILKKQTAQPSSATPGKI